MTTTKSRTRTVIRADGEVIATGVSPQRASSIAMKLGAIPAGVYVCTGDAADAKAAMARIALHAAVAHRTELVQVAEATATPDAHRAAWAAVEVADREVRFAAQAHEMAVRASMPGAAAADVMAAARARWAAAHDWPTTWPTWRR